MERIFLAAMRIAVLACSAIFFACAGFSHAAPLVLPHKSLPARMKFQEASIRLPGAFGSGFIQDRDGFLWMGLQSGLAKWDGEHISVFDTRNSALSSLTITGLLEDKEGTIWVATLGGGLNRYDKLTNAFTVFLNDSANPESIASNSLGGLYSNQALAEDEQGNIWVGSHGDGLSRLDKKTGRFTRFRHDPSDQNSLSDDRVTAVYADRSGTIWAGSQNGLNRFDYGSGQFVRYGADLSDSADLRDAAINALLEDRDGALWVGTVSRGLIHLDLKSGKLQRYLPEPGNPNSLANVNVNAIAEDAVGRLWIAYNDRVVSVLDKLNGGFVHYASDENTPDRLHGDQIDAVVTDRSGVVWIMSHSGRLNKYDANVYKFELYRHDPDDPLSIPANSVRHVFKDRQGTIWFDAGAAGFFRYDPKIDAFQRLNLHGKEHSPLLEDSSGVIWLGGFTADNRSAALHVLDRSTMRYSAEYVLPKGAFSTDMLEDPKNPHLLWFTTLGEGLGRFNKETKEFYFFRHDPNNPASIGGNSLWDMEFDQDDPGVLWLAVNGGGINRFNTGTEDFVRYSHKPDDAKSISSNSVFSLRQTRKGEFWVMAKGGALERFDKASGRFEHFSELNKRFPDDKAVNILEDAKGDLWINGPGGRLIWFNPDNGKFKAYGRDDGVQGGAAWAGANVVGDDGRLWFGGGMGLNAFYPEQVQELISQPRVVFTSLTQGGDPLALNKAPELLSEIKLNWQSSFFEFDFASLDFTNPEHNQYQYTLEGWDSEWYFAGTRNSGRYSNLSGGTYTLRVRGTNSDGVWSPHEAELKVIVTPPFWRTWWFQLLALIFALGTLGLGFLWRTASIRAHNRELEQHRDELESRVVERSAELRLAMDRLMQSEKLAALGHLVSGVAHELNTPLGNARMVSSALSDEFQKFSSALESGNVSRSNLLGFLGQSQQGFDLLERNVVRAADLVTSFKQLAVDQVSVSRRRFSLRTIVDELLGAFHSQLANSACRVELEIPDELEMEGYPGALEQVFSSFIDNSLTHGISGGGGLIRIVATLVDDAHVRISYSDNGAGIPEAILRRIFEPFFTTRMGQGRNGLGLYIAHNLIVNVMSGTVLVDSALGEGCVFELILPVVAPETGEEKLS